MADERSTPSSPCSPPCAERAAGFALVEMLAALTVAALATAAALTLTLSSRKLYETDQRRTDVNQNLRSALDLIGIDLRQAGERLPGGLPGDRDRERRRRVPGHADRAPQPPRRGAAALCSRSTAGRARPRCGSPTPGTRLGCAPVSDPDADGWPDNIDEWRDWRIAPGRHVKAYVYNPIDRQGEFFVYDDDGDDDRAGSTCGRPALGRHLPGRPAGCGSTCSRSGRYRLPGRRPAVPDQRRHCRDAVNLVTRLVDFQLRALLEDGTILRHVRHDRRLGRSGSRSRSASRPQ